MGLCRRVGTRRVGLVLLLTGPQSLPVGLDQGTGRSGPVVGGARVVPAHLPPARTGTESAVE